MTQALPLDGITVVSIEQAIAGPFATRQLADLGARVIKVERPGVGDFARSYDTTVRGLASHFVWTNRSKQSLTLDLKTSEGAEVRFFMPVLNVPFRLIFAHNGSRTGVLDNNFQPAKKFTFRFAVGTTF